MVDMASRAPSGSTIISMTVKMKQKDLDTVHMKSTKIIHVVDHQIHTKQLSLDSL